MKRILCFLIAGTMALSLFWPVLAADDEQKKVETFTADFSSQSEQWEGELLGYLGYKTDKFGTEAGWSNSKGSIVTKNEYYFGDLFEMSFSLYTDYHNGNQNGTNEDFYITVGKFKIAICDFQTRIKLYYDGQEVEGTSVCPNNKYIASKSLNYSAHFEKGNISIESDSVTYTSVFDSFDAVENAKISVTINETWQIWDEYFSSLWVGPVAVREKSFVADFSDDSKWLGDISQLKFDGDKFGNSSGWSNSFATITTLDKYDFGDNFDIDFSLYTMYKNASYTTNDDFSIIVGKFTIVICDVQTKIKLLYAGMEITGTLVSSTANDDYSKDYSYNIHIEKGNITIKSDCLEYAYDFSDFEPANKTQVSVKINETWHIWSEHFSKLSIGYKEPKINEKSFVADFSKEDQWEGLTDYLKYGEKNDCFGTSIGWSNKSGTLKTKDKYDFGDNFDIDFSLSTTYQNASYTNNDDFSVLVGKFTIVICDVQTKIKLFYAGTEITGTLVSSAVNDDYSKNYSYNIHIEKGKITIKSDCLEYAYDFADFEAVNNAQVSIKINETWHIWSEYFSKLSVGYKEPKINETSFVADFSKEDQWEGLTEYLKFGEKNNRFGNNEGWSNKSGTLKTKDEFDFGNELNVEFSLFTSYRNGSYEKNNDFYVSVGNLKIEICDFQTLVKVYYKGKEIKGKSDYKAEPGYPSTGIFDFNYTVTVKNKKITVDSELLRFTADIGDFEEMKDAKVVIGINETWHIYSEYFGSLSVNAIKEQKIYKNGGNILSTRFEETNLWEKSDMTALIDTTKGIFPKDSGWENKKGKIVTKKVYDFSSEYVAFFGLKTDGFNATYKNEFEANKKHTDYKLNIGDISVNIDYFQNGISISKNGLKVKDILSDSISFDTKSYDYKVMVSKNIVTVTQYKNDEELLKLKCDLKELSPADGVFVSLEVCEDWQIVAGRFTYLIVSNKSYGISSAESFFEDMDNQKYDWSKNAFGGNEFKTDFSNRSFWTDELLEYVLADKKKFSPQMGWDNKTGKITTKKWYNLGNGFRLDFSLFTTYMNDALKNSKEASKYKFADYSVKVGKLRIALRYHQNGMAVYYDNQLLGEIQNKELTYGEKNYSYVLLVKKGEIILRQLSGAKVLLELNLKLKQCDFSAVRVSLLVHETWQIFAGYFSSVSVSPILSYTSKYTFNATDDIKAALSAKEPERALVKSQWIVKQKTSVANWDYDRITAKEHVSGFYTSVSTEPAPIPVINTQCGDYFSQIGLYDSALFFTANYPAGNKRTTALCFEAPATGKVWIHDPEYGLISVLDSLNKTPTWCLNDSDYDAKSMHFAIYQNEKQIWPADEGEFLFSNSSYPGVTTAVRNVSFPELVIDVKQGDMIYFAVRPEHYKVDTKLTLSNNPSVLSFNPQIDYISVSGKMKLNTDREIVEEEPDFNLASIIVSKSAAVKYLSGTTSSENHVVIYVVIAAGSVLIIGLSTLAILFFAKKRRAVK